MAYRFKGAISFGLIYIPITLHTVVKNNDICFNLLDKKTKSRIQYKKTCTECDSKEVKPENIVKGYEYESGKYVIFTEEDFKKIKSKKDNTIEIISFTDMNQIDPIYYEKAYYVAPSSADKAFLLLTKAMEDAKKVAIAKCVMGTKESLIVIRIKNHEMILNTLYFEEEIQPNPLKLSKDKIDKAELDMAKALITSMSKPFDISTFKDEYRLRLDKAIKAKIAGKEITKVKEPKDNYVDDIMEALKKSINVYAKKDKKPNRKSAS